MTNSEPGSGLILFDNVVIPFVDKYPSESKTFAIMNTKPEDSIQIGDKTSSLCSIVQGSAEQDK